MLAILAAHAILAANTVSAKPVLLRYKFHQGQSHSYRMDLSYDMSTNMGSQAGPMTSEMTMTMRQTVEKVAPNGTATISTKITSSKATGTMGAMMGNATGKTSTLKMTPTGQMNGLQVPGSKAPMGMGFSNLQVGTTLPDQPVSVGSTWTSEFSMGSGPMPFHSKLVSLDSVGGHQIATIDISGDVDLSKMSGLLQSMASGSQMSGTFHLNSRMLFDNTAGVIKSTKANGRMSMSMQMNMNNQKMDIDVKGTQKMTMQLVH